MQDTIIVISPTTVKVPVKLHSPKASTSRPLIDCDCDLYGSICCIISSYNFRLIVGLVLLFIFSLIAILSIGDIFANVTTISSGTIQLVSIILAFLCGYFGIVRHPIEGIQDIADCCCCIISCFTCNEYNSRERNYRR